MITDTTLVSACEKVDISAGEDHQDEDEVKEEPDGCSMEQLMRQLESLQADIAAIGVGPTTEAPTEALLQRGGNGGNAVVWYEIHSEDEGEEPDWVPDDISCSAAMSACEKGEKSQQAFGLLAVEQKAEWMPNVHDPAAMSANEWLGMFGGHDSPEDVLPEVTPEEKVEKAMELAEMQPREQGTQTNLTFPQGSTWSPPPMPRRPRQWLPGGLRCSSEMWSPTNWLLMNLLLRYSSEGWSPMEHIHCTHQIPRRKSSVTVRRMSKGSMLRCRLSSDTQLP